MQLLEKPGRGWSLELNVITQCVNSDLKELIMTVIELILLLSILWPLKAFFLTNFFKYHSQIMQTKLFYIKYEEIIMEFNEIFLLRTE